MRRPNIPLTPPNSLAARRYAPALPGPSEECACRSHSPHRQLPDRRIATPQVRAELRFFRWSAHQSSRHGPLTYSRRQYCRCHRSRPPRGCLGNRAAQAVTRPARNWSPTRPAGALAFRRSAPVFPLPNLRPTAPTFPTGYRAVRNTAL